MCPVRRASTDGRDAGCRLGAVRCRKGWRCFLLVIGLITISQITICQITICRITIRVCPLLDLRQAGLGRRFGMRHGAYGRSQAN